VAASRNRPVRAAVAADRIGRRKDRKEMGIQFLGAAPGSARAEKVRFPLRVHRPVGCPVILGSEHLPQVISNRLVRARDFREAA
jgi:hypothetical protein